MTNLNKIGGFRMFDLLIKNMIETVRINDCAGDFSIDAVHKQGNNGEIWISCDVKIGKDGCIHKMFFSSQEYLGDSLINSEHISMDRFIELLGKSTNINVSI